MFIVLLLANHKWDIQPQKQHKTDVQYCIGHRTINLDFGFLLCPKIHPVFNIYYWKSKKKNGEHIQYLVCGILENNPTDTYSYSSEATINMRQL